jgi:hypothetical protein
VIRKWDAEHRAIDATTGSAGKLVLRLFNYPLWRLEVNGRQIATESTPDTGQMVIPIGTGENRIRIRFLDGADRKWGLLLSGMGFAVILLLSAIWKPQPL